MWNGLSDFERSIMHTSAVIPAPGATFSRGAKARFFWAPSVGDQFGAYKNHFFIKFSSDFNSFQNAKRKLLWLRFLILRFWRGSRKKSSLEYTEEDFDLKERNHTPKFVFQTVYSKIEDIWNRFSTRILLSSNFLQF